MLDRSSIVKHSHKPLNIRGFSDYVFDYVLEEWQHRPSIRGGNMTVCIAALCEDSKTVIAVTDRRLSTGAGDTDSVIKYKLVHPQWAVMFAGDELPPIPDILNAAERRMKDSDGSIEAARANISAAYRDIRLKRAEDMHLLPRGWTLEEFKAKGKAQLPEPVFAQIERGILQTELRVSLLVMGTAESKCHLFSVDEPGLSEDRSLPGYHAIGSGANNALSSLYQRGLRPTTYFQKALYCIYEAKQYAQKLGSVSVETDMWVMRPDEAQRGRIKSEAIEKELVEVWKELQPKDANLTTLQKLIDAMRLDNESPESKSK